MGLRANFDPLELASISGSLIVRKCLRAHERRLPTACRLVVWGSRCLVHRKWTLRNTVPMVACPYEYGDTAGATACVAYHDMGLCGDRTMDDVDEVEAKIMAALGDPTYRRAVAHSAFERYTTISSSTAGPSSASSTE